jgi:hypothetical protein
MRNIKTIEEWKKIEQLLLKKNYTCFKMQYDIDHEEGYHVVFINKLGIEYEIKTYDEKVKNEIHKYNKGNNKKYGHLLK